MADVSDAGVNPIDPEFPEGAVDANTTAQPLEAGSDALHPVADCKNAKPPVVEFQLNVSRDTPPTKFATVSTPPALTVKAFVAPARLYEPVNSPDPDGTLNMSIADAADVAPAVSPTISPVTLPATPEGNPGGTKTVLSIVKLKVSALAGAAKINETPIAARKAPLRYSKRLIVTPLTSTDATSEFKHGGSGEIIRRYSGDLIIYAKDMFMTYV